MDDLLTLIGESYEKSDIGEQIATETRTEVWAHIQSASRSEWYAGGKAGLQPAFVAVTPIVNYSGEKLAEWRGSRYAIYRTYFREDSDEIELYLEERAGVEAPPPAPEPEPTPDPTPDPTPTPDPEAAP